MIDQKDCCINKQMEDWTICLDEWIEWWLDEQMNGYKEGWMNGEKEGWMNR